MQRFLGAVNFNRDFPEKFAELCALLDSLRTVKGAIDWTEDLKSSFRSVCGLFAQDILLRHVDWKRTFYLTSDANNIYVAAWLGQIFDGEEESLPVACASKKLTETQQR